MNRTIAFLISLCLLAAAVTCAAASEKTVIMNIPYTDFYRAELDLPEDYEVDAVTSATDKVYLNTAAVGGSYHIDAADGTHSILGVSFPVKAEESMLTGDLFNEVGDAGILAGSPSYSYYVPETAPGYFKRLTVEDGKPVFDVVENFPEQTADQVTPVLEEVKGRRGDYKIKLNGFEFDTAAEENNVFAVIVRTEEQAYPLRHLENIFKGNELAINTGSSKLIKGVNPVKPANYASIVGQTVTEIDYYTSDGKYVFNASVALPDNLDNKGYVLMNIPYAKFYEAEVTETANLDAVSSATGMKPRAGTRVGGSYHSDPAGSDISGVIYPVYVDDLAALGTLGGIEITDDSKVEITVTLKGQESSTAYEGRDALFEAPDYSWYVLGEGNLPKQYKTLDMEKVSFSGVNKKDKELKAEAGLIYDRHADLVIRITGADDTLKDNVSGVVLVTEDGTRVGMRHLANLWRKMEIGMNRDSAEYAALKGKTVTGIRFLTESSNYVVDADLSISADELLPSLNGTYRELFPEFARDEYKDFWSETIRSRGVDEEMVPVYYAMLTDLFMGHQYGEEAALSFAENPETAAFDCYFENGLAKLTVGGDRISGADAEGNELFSHLYTYAGDVPVVYNGQDMGIALRLYRTDEPDAGIFTCFAFTDDTPGETQHIEFRYGEDPDALGNYSEGRYAYWLASGILDGYKESMIQDCISLFVSENVNAGNEQE